MGGWLGQLFQLLGTSVLSSALLQSHQKHGFRSDFTFFEI